MKAESELQATLQTKAVTFEFLFIGLVWMLTSIIRLRLVRVTIEPFVSIILFR